MEQILEKIKKEKDVFVKAKLIRYLIREKQLRVKDLSEKLGMTSSYICHLNRLNYLPEVIVDGYYSNLINISTLFTLSRLKDETKLIKIYEKVLAENLTLKQLDELIRDELYGIKDKGEFIKKEEKEKWKEQFKKKYSEEVDIKIYQTRTRGKILIEIKGNLEKTSKFLKRIVSGLLMVKD
ncbi:MAG: hypothetical protein ACPLRN_01075 [Microgenomates group bacterium]